MNSFKSFPNGASTCQLIVCATLFFSRQICIFGFFHKFFFWKVTFKRIVISTFINRVKCYTSVQEIWGCDSHSAFTTLPSASETPLFMVLAAFFFIFLKKCKTARKKNSKKDHCKVSLETYFRSPESVVVLCKNLDTEGKIHFVVAHAVSLSTSEESDLWPVVLCSHILLPRISDGLLWDFLRCRLEHLESKHISGHVLFFRTVDHGRVVSVYYPTHSLNIPGQQNAWKPCACKVWFPYEIPTFFPAERSISRDKIVTDRMRVSECVCVALFY